MPENAKRFTLKLTTIPRSDVRTLKGEEIRGIVDAAGDSAKSGLAGGTNPRDGTIVVSITFTPQPDWEYVRFKNTSNDAWTFNIKMKVATECDEVRRRLGSPSKTLEMTGSFGVSGHMLNDTRGPIIEVYPETFAVDPGAPPRSSTT